MVKRSVRKTVLIVCEGKRDEAFLRYLRSLYCAGDATRPQVKVKQSRGRGGDGVAMTLLRQRTIENVDLAVAFTEADVPPSPAYAKKLRADRRVRWVVADPCLEGLLLAILKIPVPDLTAHCKARIADLEPRDLYSPEEYALRWARAELEAARERIEGLDLLIRGYEGR